MFQNCHPAGPVARRRTRAAEACLQRRQSTCCGSSTWLATLQVRRGQPFAGHLPGKRMMQALHTLTL